MGGIAPFINQNLPNKIKERGGIMYLEKITGGYFLYCQFCVHENHCELHHHEFLGIQLPDLTEMCTGRILHDSRRETLVCENCGAVLERPFEKGICSKFNPAPVFQAGELPLLNPEYQAVAKES